MIHFDSDSKKLVNRKIIVLEKPSKIFSDIEGVTVALASDYLGQEIFQKERGLRIYNLCSSYSYQSIGYYVSLLAMARGHRVIPDAATIEEIKSRSLWKIRAEEIDDLIQKSLFDLKTDKFDLSIYFGQNTAKKYEKLAKELSRAFAAPLTRAKFQKNGKWRLSSLKPIGLEAVPENHQIDVVNFARDFFHKDIKKPKKRDFRFSLAILVNPDEPTPPSNSKAIKRFCQAAENLGIETEVIGPKSLQRLAEFDGLFIRETTNVNHHTYRFAQTARALGLIVIDDPDSIIRCTNKVYLAELFNRYKIPTPGTTILYKTTAHEQLAKLNLPLILKIPDSAFSVGVVKVECYDAANEQAQKMFESTELLIAQNFMPTSFDWRVGVFGGEVLFVCRYFMAGKHWQIYRQTKSGKRQGGDFETIATADAPEDLLKLALKATKLIGDGLYGVDIKEHEGKFYVIEINDNPNIDGGIEDQICGNELYDRFMGIIVQRFEDRTKNHESV